MKHLSRRSVLDLLLLLLGSAIFALNMNTFIAAGDLVPGGFSGLSILIQGIARKFFHVSIPFSVLNIGLNAIPAILSYRLVGKRFTLLSCFNIFFFSLLVDLLPKYEIVDDPLLVAVFGAILGGVAISLVLNSGASSGGTDFIAMSISAKYKTTNAFNYMLYFSAAVILTYGLLFGMDKALYSIIYQFCYTQVINALYRRYKKKTLFIVTEEPEKLSHALMELTHHSSTVLEGYGAYTQKRKYVVYTVLSDNDIRKISHYISQDMPGTFVNVLNSTEVIGNFFIKPLE
ncbi:MAG: YitT family protein [Clostridiales bacterium]|nr:YitT family protein [Clostridiales bacterium]MDY4181470.1 YitT family protein [Pseudoflavonifractor sp.]